MIFHTSEPTHMNTLHMAASENQVAELARTQKSDLTIGKLLLTTGKLTPQDAERVLKTQKEQGLRFGEAAIKLGLVTEADIQQVLSIQFDYPYLQDGKGKFSPELIAAYSPFCEEVESLRALRAQLLLRWFGEGRRALAVTSPLGTEGASNLVANLAIVFSQLGERTLLVDANMRQPRQHQLFSLGEGKGLSDILAGRADVSVLKRINDFVDLSVLPAGTLPPNPAELLARSDFSLLLEELEKNYDVILIDTPAACVASDLQTVAARAGGALLVSKRNVTRLKQLSSLRDMVAAGAEVVGSVVMG
jgi:chain length determinant protein tyrosine kinase EpsG